jgi:hypothetical protein
MILYHAIQQLNARLREQVQTSKCYGLAEIVRKEDKRYPAEFINGEFVSVGGYDKNGVTTYWRKTGTAQVQTLRNEVVSCKAMLNISYPMRLVVVMQNGKKSAYNEDTIFEQIAAALTGKYSIAQTIWATFDITGYNTDRESIEAQEYVGVPVNMRSKFAYLSINCTITVQADPTCLNNLTP